MENISRSDAKNIAQATERFQDLGRALLHSGPERCFDCVAGCPNMSKILDRVVEDGDVLVAVVAIGHLVC